jgi:ubiquinone/menaquinone biosynthesis C-methylase UbiE
MQEGRLPYFDFLFAELAKQNSAVEKSFGRHVHWGYWADPEQASGDAEDYGRAAEQLTLELCRLAGIAEGERVLDVGCGFGGTIASLNERFARLKLTGLNIDVRQLERARQQVLPLQANEVQFCQGDACRLPFADAGFDRLLAVECIFHFPSREAFFQEAFRVLKPGGTLTLSDFVPSPLYLPMAGLTSWNWVERYNLFGHCDVRYTIGRYRRLARRTGFASVAERNITGHTLPTYRYVEAIVARTVPAGSISAIAGPLIRTQRLLSRLGLLNYYLLSFRKP